MIRFLGLIVCLALPCVHTECISKQPPICYVPSYDPDANNSYNREQLNRAMIYATKNLTVYESNTAVFRFEVNHSVISDSIPAVYINSCYDSLGDKSSCKLMKDSIIQCQYNNVTMADNGKKIAFFAYSPSVLKGAGLCHQPFSYLTVLSKPVSVTNVSYTFNNCDSIYLLFSLTNDSTYTEYELLDHNGDLLLEDGVNSTTDSVLIPSHVLYNHTGVYRVIVTPTNPAGSGPSTELILDLSTINILAFDVNKITVGKGFIGQIYVKVNTSCSLTIPNIFKVKSSCSKTERHRDHHFNKEQIILSHRLQPYRHNCTITVSDEVGTNQTFVNCISTFHTQSYDIQVLSDSVNVTCTFISGTTATGCAIVIYNKNSNSTKPVHTELYPVRYSGYVNIGPIPPGHYSLHICDAIDTLDCPDAIIVFKEDFVILPSSMTIASSVISTSHRRLLSSSSPTQSSTLPSPACDESCRETNITVNKIVITVAVLGFTTVIGLIIAILFVAAILFKMRKSKNQHNLQSNRLLGGTPHLFIPLLPFGSPVPVAGDAMTYESSKHSISASSGEKVIETEITHKDTSNGLKCSAASKARSLPVAVPVQSQDNSTVTLTLRPPSHTIPAVKTEPNMKSLSLSHNTMPISRSSSSNNLEVSAISKDNVFSEATSLTKRPSDDSELSLSSLNTPVPTPTSSLRLFRLNSNDTVTPELTQPQLYHISGNVLGVPGNGFTDHDEMLRTQSGISLKDTKRNDDELVTTGHGSKPDETKSEKCFETIQESKAVQDNNMNNTSSTVTGGHSQFAVPSNNTTTTSQQTTDSYSSTTGLMNK